MWIEALVVIIVVVVIWLVWVIINFRGWKRNLLLTLKKNSTVIETEVGPFNYKFKFNTLSVISGRHVCGLICNKCSAREAVSL